MEYIPYGGIRDSTKSASPRFRKRENLLRSWLLVGRKRGIFCQLDEASATEPAPTVSRLSP